MTTVQPDVMDKSTKELVWTPSTTTLVIQDEQDYIVQGERLQTIVGFKKRVAEWFAPLKQKANEAHKALCKRETDTLAPAEKEEQVIRRSRQVWREEQDRIRREEERKRAEEARVEEEKRRLAEAAALEAEGLASDNPELILEAEDLISQPVSTPIVIMPRSVPTQKGLAERARKWKFRVRNAKLVPEEYKVIDEKSVQKVVDALKDRTKIPGIEIFSVAGGESVRGR